MKQLITFILLFICTGLFANDSLVISRLLQRIDDLQVKEDGVFPKGSIPAYRMYALNKNRYKADVTAFFSAVTSLALLDNMNELSPPQQQQAKTIINRSMNIYPKFKSRTVGRDTYNFWPTDTPKIFPNSGWLNFFDKKQAIPDDLDDTVLLLMAQSASDSVAKKIHAFMQLYKNRPEKKIRNTFKEYENIGAYETWFGKKMPVDFDIGVLANVLYFVQKYNLPWTATDSASINLMVRMLEDKKHITAASYISPHYAKLPVILYHVSRLMALKQIPELEKLKPQLIDDANRALLSADNFMDQVLLSTSLLRWGVAPPDLAPYKGNSMEEMVEDEYGTSFFIANIAHMFPNPLKQWVGSVGVGRFYYYCPAYNNMLLIENLVWRRRRGL
jgi:hypothetical protein